MGRDLVLGDVHFHFSWTAPALDLGGMPDLERLRDAYLEYLRTAHEHLDFRGIPQLEKIPRQLPLSSVFVPLRARAEAPEADTWLRLAGRRWHGEDPASMEALVTRKGADEGKPVPIDEALVRHPAIVLLGDPGAGKSTWLKVAALELAHRGGGPLPILLPLSAYADVIARRGDIGIQEFMAEYYRTRGSKLSDLAPLFDEALRAGKAVVLFDGLDEIGEERRDFLVRIIDEFAAGNIRRSSKSESTAPGNRIIVTSRIVGYREAPLADRRWRTYTLVDFSRDQIEAFAERWTLAAEIAVHGDSEPTRARAAREKEELLSSILSSAGIEALASNPLLLTILTLIKRQGVTLPEQRVELYELYLKTLIEAWGKARSLDRRPVGRPVSYMQTIQILGPLALWLREYNPISGLVHRADLERWVARHYCDELQLTRRDAQAAGEDFLKCVREQSNLLIERGKDQYGFLHLTLEEMLAAKGVAQRGQKDIDTAADFILDRLDKPAWRETILLTVGVLGVVQQRPEAAGEVLTRMCADALAGSKRGYNVTLAGEALLDVGVAGVGPTAASKVTETLVSTMRDGECHVSMRRTAGLVLGRLGWRPPDLDELVAIPAGSFLYGEGPKKKKIDHRYWIGKYPVTNAQYARFVEDGGYDRAEYWSREGWAWRTGELDMQDSAGDYNWLESRPPENRETPFWWGDPEKGNLIFPVVGVTHFEAEAYANWLGKRLAGRDDIPDEMCRALRQGCCLRLPTEAEWERAARGTDGRQYPWGDEFDIKAANCADAWAGKNLETKDWKKWIDSHGYEDSATTAVCTFPDGAGPEELSDAAGNVWEWTASFYRSGSGQRVLRGGSWIYASSNARCAYRRNFDPDFFYNNVGFRLVLAPSLAHD